ncbi:transcription factor Gaf1 [Schizosaccharomyces japonicus yFS275]|uniref:Transcription factor Gaf1 n=1 Tax=Schizosaccharomyces japonicus (strain yFS275 / FY16936) TaxID=402676 RepID=B6K112_SCHJY|nr:transcription factor Gaf1 [Schizosaccharomyces japonicus yFS275]EEB07633.1 transcription factor Gaf1 [Schizosaccharomyces japonicus yFS275]
MASEAFDILKSSEHPALAARQPNAADSSPSLKPDEFEAGDIWRMISKAKASVPNGHRVENLTWRMMSINLRKSKLGSSPLSPASSADMQYGELNSAHSLQHSSPNTVSSHSMFYNTDPKTAKHTEVALVSPKHSDVSGGDGADVDMLPDAIPPASVPDVGTGSSFMEFNYVQRRVRKTSFDESEARGKKRSFTLTHFPASNENGGQPICSTPKLSTTANNNLPLSSNFSNRTVPIGKQTVPGDAGFASTTGATENPMQIPRGSSGANAHGEESIPEDPLNLDFDVLSSEPFSYPDNATFSGFVDAGSITQTALSSSPAHTAFSFEQNSLNQATTDMPNSFMNNASEDPFSRASSYSSQSYFGFPSPVSAGLTPTQSFIPELAANGVFDSRAREFSSPMTPNCLPYTPQPNSLPAASSNSFPARPSMYRAPHKSFTNIHHVTDLNAMDNVTPAEGSFPNRWNPNETEVMPPSSQESYPVPQFVRVGTAMGIDPMRSSVPSYYNNSNSNQFAHREMPAQAPAGVSSSPLNFNHMPYLSSATAAKPGQVPAVDTVATGMKKRVGGVPQQYAPSSLSYGLKQSSGVQFNKYAAVQKNKREKSEERKAAEPNTAFNDAPSASKTSGAKNNSNNSSSNNNSNSGNSNNNSGGNAKNTKQNVPTCTNCQTRTTPLWRRSPDGHPLCNACGLFMKINGVVRPLSLKTDVIKKRNRSGSNNSGSRSGGGRKYSSRKNNSHSNAAHAQQQQNVNAANHMRKSSSVSDAKQNYPIMANAPAPVQRTSQVNSPPVINGLDPAMSFNMPTVVQNGFPYEKTGMPNAMDAGLTNGSMQNGVFGTLGDAAIPDSLPADPQSLSLDSVGLQGMSRPWDWYSVM